MRGLLLAAALLLFGCGTVAAPAGDDNAVRPNAHAGPFRDATADELPDKIRKVPYVLDDPNAHYRESMAVDLDETGSLGRVALYVVADLAPGTGIYRFVSPDGRSFGKNPDPATPVLVPGAAWEGAFVGKPDVHVIAGKIWMLYEAAGGIGLARSDDGRTFTREPGPVLGPDPAAAWEGGKTPGAPGLLKVADDDFRLFYAVNDRIGEAHSSDGITWKRAAGGPLLAPLGGSDADAPFDSASVGDPYALLATSAEGRRITRVYYAGGNADGQRGIGMAARFGVDGPLTRATAPVFPVALDARSPAVLPFSGFTLLYLTQIEGTASTQDYPAVALGIAPGNASIPPPGP
jgi:hypothetical protein